MSFYFFVQIVLYFFIGSGTSKGIIIQRFPEKDWEDTPFIDGIEWVNITVFIYFNLLQNILHFCFF